MIDVIFTIIGATLYIAATIVLFKQLTTPESEKNKHTVLILGITGAIFHADILARHIFTDSGLQMGITHVASLATWFVTCLLIITALKKPIENLGLFILPLAALTLTLQYFMPVDHIVNTADHKGLGAHIVLSILAYSLLGLAAVQAVLLSIKEKHLHNRRPGGLIAALPPLETMESLLVQMIVIGFALQTTSLISGYVHLEDMFAQNLAHKTILSIIAWAVFAILLTCRKLYGWRGKTLVRWTISGFFTLLLAYFGSKYVLEIILGR
ncbi:MAG: cytochrome c biogenesis protein CcsA [Gammaproteobacteria bacterium]|nr:cytochrome c biogenesis protein CcsA [Gammaproteobacteria bacterium]